MTTPAISWSAADLRFAYRPIAKLRPYFAGKTVAQAHKLASRKIKDAFGRHARDPMAQPIACRGQGCCGCCLHQREIDVSAFEVERILDQVAADGRLAEVVQRAERLTDRSRGGACPLLTTDGRCSVYKFRPLSCAAYHSLDRAACHAGPHAEIPHAVMLWIETAVIAGFGMVPVEQIKGGVPLPRFRLFAELARRGRARLKRENAA